MAKNRIHRINEEVQRELASLLRTVKDPRVKDTMLSITHVDTTTDLRYAKIYVSALDKNTGKRGAEGDSSPPQDTCAGNWCCSCATPSRAVFEADDSIAHGTHILEVLRGIEEKKACWRRETKPHDD